MFRSQDINSTNWEQRPQGNPFFTVSNYPDSDPNPLPCNPAYSGLFTSQTGRLYFHASRPSYDPKYSGIYFYTLVSKLDGDLNIDGKVDIYDYNQLITDFGKTGSAGFIPADINTDGKVDIYDYNILVGNFGKSQ